MFNKVEKTVYVILRDSFEIQNIVEEELTISSFDKMDKEEILKYFDFDVTEFNMDEITVMEINRYKQIIETNLEIVNRSRISGKFVNTDFNKILRLKLQIKSERDING